jgi:hypothetical protein
VIAAFTALVIIVTYVVYRAAALSYFTEDDFGWLTAAASFRFATLLHLGNYSHFYRPIVELYFAAGYRLFGCEPSSFHLASVTIHLATILVLYLFADALTAKPMFAATAALLFASLPGYVEAVAWVAAITDLLPALWYISTLWLYLRFLQSGRITIYLLALATFAASLLTHESAATLLPLMVLVHLVAAGPRDRVAVARLVPFGALLGVFLAIAYTVNSRSYLISEGHYRLGWHAFPNIIQYIVSLYVGMRNLPSYAAIVAVVMVLLVRGTPRVRLFVLWILITVLPASFFTWGNVSRYLYLPAAGFALLLAEAARALHQWCEDTLGPRSASIIAALLVAALAVRFMVFARKESERFRDRTEPYERYVAAVRSTTPVPPPDQIVRLDRETIALLPESVRDQVAEVAYCMARVHVVER